MEAERNNLRAGDPEEDIGKYRAILDKDPNSRVFAPLAEAYRKAGFLDDAIDTARSGLEQHPSYLSGRVALARALFEKGEFAEAQREISQVVQSAPDNLMAHKLLGQIHLQGGSVSEAEKSFNMVLLLDPRNREAQAALENLRTPPAHTPPPVESAFSPAAAEPDSPFEEASASVDTSEEGPVEAEAFPEGLVFEGEEEGSPFDQSFDDVIEPAVPEKEEAESTIDLEFEDVGEVVGADVGSLDPGADDVPEVFATVEDAPAAEDEGSDAPFDLGAHEEPKGVEAAADEAVVEENETPGDEDVPFDLGSDEDLEGMEAAVEEAVAVDEGVAGDEGVPFDLGADEDVDGVEAAPEEAVPAGDEAVGDEAVPFDLGGADDLETVDGAADEGLPLDLGADDGPEAAENTVADAAAVEEAAAGSTDVPFDLSEDDLETAAEFEVPPATSPEAGGAQGDAFNTETLAHLYIKQGFYDKAAGVYEAMVREKPEDSSLRQKLEEARSLAGMMARAESPASPAAEELTAPRSPEPADPAGAAEDGEHPAIVGLRRFLEQLKEKQP